MVMKMKACFGCCLNLFLSLWVLMTCTGCEHRPLEDPYWNENLFVRVYIDENLRNVTFGFYDESKKKPEYFSPEVLRVVLFDEASGKAVVERYIYDCGKDEKGYYIQGLLSAPDGKYNMLVYNFDTSRILIKDGNSYSGITAYTSPITENEADRIFASRGRGDDEAICKQPDHLFVASVEGVVVNSRKRDFTTAPDTIMTESGAHPEAESVVKTYYMQINVKGAEYVRSAVALISGMAGSKKLSTREMVMDHEASIYFGLNNGKDKNRAADDTHVAYATFNTFGKLPHTEGYIDITFEFKTIYNSVQTESFRVTDMFETEQVKEKQWIIIDKTIEIVPPEDADIGGGMSPGVSDWEEIEGSITI